MEILNRSAAIVKPRHPYLEWARSDDEEGLAESVFEDLRSEPAVFLLPEYEDPTSRQEVLEELWPVLFEAMLEGWVTDEASWPKNRTLEMFQEWFEVQTISLVQDLHRGETLERIRELALRPLRLPLRVRQLHQLLPQRFAVLPPATGIARSSRNLTTQP